MNVLWSTSNKCKYSEFVPKVIIIICIISTLFLPNIRVSLIVAGIINIACSAWIIFQSRNSRLFALLCTVIAVINICWSFSVCLSLTGDALNWQTALISLPENYLAVKSGVIFQLVFALTVGVRKVTRDYVAFTSKTPNNSVAVLMSILFGISLLFGYNRGLAADSTGYVSNGSALYEYGLVFCVFMWYFASNNRLSRIGIYMCSLLYCAQGFFYGDRSSSFPMIILIFALAYSGKIKTEYLIGGSLLGIFLGNALDLARQGVNVAQFSELKEILARGLHVNTFSYSHYAGVQILRFKASNLAYSHVHLLEYIRSILIGSTTNTDLAALAKQNGFVNNGGGMIANYFYYWGGFAGVIIGGLIVGLIINQIYTSGKVSSRVLQYTVLVFCIRWYVYFPLAFFRSALWIPTIIMIGITLLNRLLLKRDYQDVF